MAVRFDPNSSAGLPEDFWIATLYKGHTTAPDNLPVNSIITDRSMDMSFILCQASDAINAKRLVQMDITSLSDSSSNAKGTAGNRVVTLTIPSGTKDQYRGGTLRTSGAIERVYKIQGNTARDSAGKVEFTITQALLASIPTSETVTVRSGMKVKEALAASDDPTPALGMSLFAIEEDEYFFAQQTGEADISSNAIVAGDIDKALTKGTGGRVSPAGEGEQIVAYHSADRAAITGTPVIPVRLCMGNGWW